MLPLSASIGWLIAGAVLLALEAFGIPGIGLVFAGLGAILTGIAIEIGAAGANDYVLQAAIFFASTIIFAALLWNKMKAWRLNPKEKPYSNMVGDIAIVADAGLKKGTRGQVRWSGTLMFAEIDGHDTATEFAAGTQVRISAVEGNVLKVKLSQ
jgi:membrane protein implicated in regulation of membrane protease activity